MASRLKAYSDLFRFENALTGLIGVLIGAIVVNGATFEFSDVIVVSSFGISVMFFMFCWNAYNDITDIENDAMNRPDRPLPSGRLSVNSARKGMYFSLLVSITSLSFGLLELRRGGLERKRAGVELRRGVAPWQALGGRDGDQHRRET